MFLREALCRHAEIEEDIARLYAALAARDAEDAGLAARWTEMADCERSRARVLQAVVAAQAVAEDDGPFLVHVPLELAQLRKAVEAAQHEADETNQPIPVEDLKERIEASGRAAIYQNLLELGRAEVTRVLRLFSDQIPPSRADRTLLDRLREAAELLATAEGELQPVR